MNKEKVQVPVSPTGGKKLNLGKDQPGVSGAESRLEEFQREVLDLQKKHAVELYAVLAVQPNGDIIPVVKVRDVLTLEVK